MSDKLDSVIDEIVEEEEKEEESTESMRFTPEEMHEEKAETKEKEKKEEPTDVSSVFGGPEAPGGEEEEEEVKEVAEAKEEVEEEEGIPVKKGEKKEEEKEEKEEKEPEEEKERPETEQPGTSEAEEMLGVEKPPRQKRETKFDFSPSEASRKQFYLIAGKKGHGKTYLSFTFPGTIACLSYDRKSIRIRDLMGTEQVHGQDRILVWDPMQWYDTSTGDRTLETSDDVYTFSIKLLQKLRRGEFWNGHKPNWIVVDGTEELMDICKYRMLNTAGAKFLEHVPFEKWRLRKIYVQNIFRTAQRAAKKGVIYTTYLEETKEVIEDGQVVEKSYDPKWVESIKKETENVIKVIREKTKNGFEFYAEVNSSKVGIPEREYNITDAGIQKIWKSAEGEFV